MILGSVLGLPVVAAVATRDRHWRLLLCPFCDRVHRHGNLAGGLGSADGARFRHCRSEDLTLIADAGVIPDYYVLKEVPGRVTYRSKTIAYDHAAIAAMGLAIQSLIESYAAKWGPHMERNRKEIR